MPEAAPRIEIEVTVADLSGDLSGEQKSTFGDFVEFWDSSNDEFYEAADPSGVDPAHISEALRITFTAGMTRKRTISKGVRSSPVASPNGRACRPAFTSCVTHSARTWSCGARRCGRCRSWWAARI